MHFAFVISHLKSEPFLFPLSGIPGSRHMLCPCATPIWDTAKEMKILMDYFKNVYKKTLDIDRSHL